MEMSHSLDHYAVTPPGGTLASTLRHTVVKRRRRRRRKNKEKEKEKAPCCPVSSKWEGREEKANESQTPTVLQALQISLYEL